jgi:hypothetical protein
VCRPQGRRHILSIVGQRNLGAERTPSGQLDAGGNQRPLTEKAADRAIVVVTVSRDELWLRLVIILMVGGLMMVGEMTVVVAVIVVAAIVVVMTAGGRAGIVSVMMMRVQQADGA